VVDIEVDQASMKIHLQIEYNKLCALLHRSSIDQIVLKLSPESADRVVICNNNCRDLQTNKGDFIKYFGTS